MPYDIDTAPVVIKVPSSVALPPGNVSGPEWEEYKGRVIAIEGLGLVDLSDVDDAGLVDGQTLIYEAATGVWKPGLPAGNISGVMNAAGQTVVSNAARLQLGDGLTVIQHSTDTTRAVASVVMGASGSSNALARQDHIHTAIRRANKSYPVSGNLSSGTRTLDSVTVTQLDPEIAYLIEAELVGDVRGAGPGAGEVTPRLNIPWSGVSSWTDRPPVRTVGGVDVEFSLDHDSREVTGVTSVTVTATMKYTSGDPTYVKGGRIKVRAFPRR